MRKFIGLTLMAAILAVASVSAADTKQKVKTKSNIKNDRALGVTSQGDVADNGLVFSWGDNSPRIKMPASSQGPYQLSRADWTPKAGPTFAECSDVCADSAQRPANPAGLDLSDRVANSAGPGSVTLALRIRSSGSPGPGGVCPVDGSPIKGVVISGGRNPGADYALQDAVITHCDATGITISYQSMAINEKGTGSSKH